MSWVELISRMPSFKGITKTKLPQKNFLLIIIIIIIILKIISHDARYHREK
jgi:hypothetical protein